MENANQDMKILPNQAGFSFVKLLGIVVVLALFSVAAGYVFMTQKDQFATLQIVSSLKSDLSYASQQIKLFQTVDVNSNFPTANNCPTPAPTEVCLVSHSDNKFTYIPNNNVNPKTFTLDVVSNSDKFSLKYHMTNSSDPVQVSGQ